MCQNMDKLSQNGKVSILALNVNNLTMMDYEIRMQDGDQPEVDAPSDPMEGGGEGTEEGGAMPDGGSGDENTGM